VDNGLFPLKDYEGRYSITVDGRIISHLGKKDRLMRLFLHETGYYVVTLRKGGRYFTRKVHRLLAIQFIPNTSNKPEVNHKDGNKEHNVLSNLEWATHLENMHHAEINGLNSHPKRATKRSKYRGVSWDKGLKSWVAQYESLGVCKHLGRFSTEELAREAYLTHRKWSV